MKAKTQNKYFKNNHRQVKNEIVLIAGSFIKTKNVPGDRECGTHALSICLKQNGLFRKTVEILNMLDTPNCKSSYCLKDDDDLAFICDQFNLNLFIGIRIITYLYMNIRNIQMLSFNGN